MEYNVDFANGFKRAFLYGKYDISDIEGNQLIIPGLEEPIILYEYERVSEVFEELNRLFRRESISPNDVAIVSFSRQGVRDLIDQYNSVCDRKSEMSARKVSRNSRTVSTNDECSRLYMGDKNKINIAERVLKRSFKPNYGTTKALVIHSLKGLEVKNIVLFLDDLNYFDDSKLENTEELIYTAITRAKHRLIIAYKNKEEVKPQLVKYIDYFESQTGVNNVIKYDEYKKFNGYNLLF